MDMPVSEMQAAVLAAAFRYQVQLLKRDGGIFYNYVKGIDRTPYALAIFIDPSVSLKNMCEFLCEISGFCTYKPYHDFPGKFAGRVLSGYAEFVLDFDEELWNQHLEMLKIIARESAANDG